MKPALALLTGMICAIAAAEATLRLLPVVSGLANPPVTREAPVVRYRPEAAYSYSRGWDMRQAQRGSFNSLGYPDREIAPHKPVFAIIGDSYIEALMIRQGERLSDVLNAKAGVDRFASFGVSGADLPDYLVTARWLKRTMPLEGAAFVITDGDVAHSVQAKRRGFWYAARDGQLRLNGNADFTVRNALDHSALATYLLYNLKFGPAMIGAAFAPAAQALPAIRGLPGEAGARRFVAEAAALQRSGVRVMLVLDADRVAIYQGRASALPEMTMLARLGREAGIEVIDLAPVFADTYRIDRKRFDFGKADSHWNGYGHRIVAQAIERALQTRPNTQAAPVIAMR